MFDRLKIVQRFFLVVLAFWLALLGISGLSYWGMASARDSIRDVHDDHLMSAKLLADISTRLVSNRMEMLLVFQHDPTNPLSKIHEHPVSLHIDNIAKRQEEILAPWKQHTTEQHEADEKIKVLEVDAKLQAWDAEFGKVLGAVKGGDFSAATMAFFLKAGREQGASATKAIDDLRAYHETMANLAATEAAERYTTFIIAFWAMIVLAALPASWLAFVSLQRVSRGFARADETARAVAGGDLTTVVPTDGTDEIGHLLQQMETMRSSLHRVISQVRAGSDSIASASGEVATGTLDLSNRTEQQAGSLQQTATATEQLASTVQSNADQADTANQLAANASKVAARGGQVVSEVVGTMQAINVSSRKIVDIISAIDGIAFQTNILALNAAVEAARAGEQGRGFAVVASEVRSLAGRSAEAAKEIKGLIADSVEKVDVGTELVAQAGSTMEEIVHSIQRVASIIGEIAAASREQSAGITQINQSVAQLDSVTQQNAALVEQTSAASTALQDQASSLARLAASFNLGNEGGASSLARLT